MKSEALSNLRRYWEDLRGDRIAPYRAELDPRKFEDVLENMFILEQLNPSQIRVRLAGMALCELMGMEVRGMPPEAFMSAEHRGDFDRHLNTVLSGPSVVDLDLSAVDVDGDQVAAQMLLLPLRSDFGEVTRILGCVICETTDIRAPVNFRIDAERTRVIQPSVGSERPRPDLPGFSDPGAMFTPAPSAPVLRAITGNPDAPARGTTERKRNHLRVVQSS